CRKVIHTNGTKEHAERILNVLGVSEHFQAIYDIRFNHYQPKPCSVTLQMLLDAESTPAHCSIVVDDMADNLHAAKQLGAKTVWVETQKGAHIYHDLPWDFHVADIHDLSLHWQGMH
ncbi:MAG: HAD hydrolase-like protein, partial [Zetaproteobacteria bacterium]|nr:HAD hydrolase-like protein [Zetaproteobacteria bacterium]